MGSAQSFLPERVSGGSADCQAECLRALLIQRLERQGVERPCMTGFLRELAKLLNVSPDISPPAANAKLRYLGWTDVAVDYQSIQLAAVCLAE